MYIPPYLLEQIAHGRIILFLGAGANVGATDENGKAAPFGRELGARLSEKFLGGGFRDSELSYVADLSISQADQNTVEKFIASELAGLTPADYHLIIPKFKWRGIVTLNYDKIVEDAYSQCSDNLQNVMPVLSDADHIDEILRDNKLVPLLKIHGCISRTGDPQLPLVLTIDQFIKAGTNRSKLYNLFTTWCSEYSVLIVGSAIVDYDVRKTIQDVVDRIQKHPTYCYIKPNFQDSERHYWSTKSIELIEGTFEEFLREIDKRIPINTRVLSTLQSSEHPIHARYVIDEPVASGLVEAFETNYVYVTPDMPIENGTPENFYRGDGLGWYPIYKNLDVKRNLLEQILLEVVLLPEDDRPTDAEVYVIKAEAGAGKSVFLRRLAWETGVSLSRIAIFYQGYSWNGMDDVLDIYRTTKDRIFLFVDDASDNRHFIGQIVSYSRRMKVKVTVITAERINEWNMHCESIQSETTNQYQLKYLSHSEILDLVRLLDEHSALGPILSKMTHDLVVDAFKEMAGRQLLVALHEATQGRPFEEIIIDEYNSIPSEEGKRLYLTVCALNRLRVPVRAGVISRIHKILFEEFEQRLMKPLENVVIIDKLPWGDYCYRARHSEIADIVFIQVLTDPHDRYNEYVEIINALDPMYSIDEDTLRMMLRAKSIHSLFPDYTDAKSVFEVASEKLGDNAYLLQQMANYERIRPDGNLGKAMDFLNMAISINPSDESLLHTMAEVLLKRADFSNNQYERERFRSDANAVLSRIRGRGSDQSYNDVTRCKISMQKVQDCIADPNIAEKLLKESIKEVEGLLQDMKQFYPHNAHVLSCEVSFAELLKDNERCENVLRNANESNPRDLHIAIRYSRILRDRQLNHESRDVLRAALEGNRSDKRINYEYAENLRLSRESSPEELSYYYRRSYTDGDGNYLSQFWHARYLYEIGGRENRLHSKEVFRRLREVRISPDERAKIRDAVGGMEKPEVYSGSVLRAELSHCFVTVDKLGDSCYAPKQEFISEEWRDLRRGDYVNMKIGFNMRGVLAYDVRKKL